MTDADALAYDELVFGILANGNLADAVAERHVIHGRVSLTVKGDGVRIER